MENACLAHAVNTGQEVYYWREEPWEVDALVVGIGATHLVEIKTGGYSTEDLRGLAHAVKRFPAFEPVVLCDCGEERVARAAGFRAMPWPDFLMDRPGVPV